MMKQRPINESLEYGAGGIKELQDKRLNKDHVVGEKAQGKRPNFYAVLFHIFFEIFSFLDCLLTFFYRWFINQASDSRQYRK